MITTVRQVASWAAMVWPETDSSGLTPNIGGPASNPMLTHVRGRRTSLRSSTRSIRHLPSLAAALRRRAGAAGPGGTAGPPAGQREEHVLEGGALDHQLADGHAAGDQVA